MTLAREELRAASTLMKDSPRQAVYFQQQTVEKLLRGVLEAEDIFAGPTHNIRGLTDLLPKGHRFYDLFLEFEELSSAATRYRYPGGAGRLFDADDRQIETFQPKIARLLADVDAFMHAKGYETGGAR